MTTNKSLNVNRVLKKIKNELQIKSDKALSEVLNIKPNTLSNWKKRNTLDYNAVINMCQLFNIDLNKILIEDYILAPQEKPDIHLVLKKNIQDYCQKTLDGISLPKFNFNLPNISRVFQVPNNLMSPVIKENSFIICDEVKFHHLKDHSFIVCICNSKDFYLSVFKEQRDGYLFLDSKTYARNSKELKIPISDVNETWIVKGVIFKEAFPFIEENIKNILEDPFVY